MSRDKHWIYTQLILDTIKKIKGNEIQVFGIISGFYCEFFILFMFSKVDQRFQL